MSQDEIPLTIEEIPAPVLYRSLSRVDNFTTLAGANFLKRPDENVQDVHNRVKNLAQRRLIHRRIADDAKPTSPAYFGIDDLAVAETLFALYDGGVRDAVIAEAASRACYAWDETCNPQPAFIPDGITPIVAAMVGAARGESWACRVSVLCDERTNERRLFAGVFNTDFPPVDAGQFLPPSYQPRMHHHLNISVALLRFAKAIRAATERSTH
ncbi:MAG TPA: hypothetical protein VG651_08515 [Stellaceae bacterium]|nr:hypothetical protein [Stellaceae bacterium]